MRRGEASELVIGAVSLRYRVGGVAASLGGNRVETARAKKTRIPDSRQPAQKENLTETFSSPKRLMDRAGEAMADKKGQAGDLLQGTLDLLILKSLARGPMHGYGVAEWIHESSQDVLRVEEGALYPALHRLELRGLLSAEWGASENNRRAKYYALTVAGKKQLTEETEFWRRMSGAVARVLQTA
jgi:transcriptional regulator